MPISRTFEVFGLMSTKQVTVNVCAITAQIKMVRTYFAHNLLTIRIFHYSQKLKELSIIFISIKNGTY